jgi:hypothetical protein
VHRGSLGCARDDKGKGGASIEGQLPISAVAVRAGALFVLTSEERVVLRLGFFIRLELAGWPRDGLGRRLGFVG